jgi:tRNA(Arg) A34 adenosine deaminase TadA
LKRETRLPNQWEDIMPNGTDEQQGASCCLSRRNLLKWTGEAGVMLATSGAMLALDPATTVQAAVQQPWKQFDRIVVPDWLIEDQNKLQAAKYPDDKSKMALVFRCARQNAETKSGAPLAAGVFLADGSLLAIGVDGPGIGGHEMTNALILASNLVGSRSFRTLPGWDFFSLAPPCVTCLGNIYSEKPSRFVYAVTYEDLRAALDMTGTALPKADWSEQLAARGIKVEGPTDRQTGLDILRTVVR